MKKRLGFLSIFLLYIAALCALMRFDIALMIQPMPIVSVLAGIVILTLFRYRKKSSLRTVLTFARWNALFSGALISLLSLLSEITKGTTDTTALAQNLIPLIYAGIAYLLISLVLSFMKNNVISPPDKDPLNASIAWPVLRKKGFSERECHVALKLLEGLPNKQIANQLYISETTVKKHIQNLFRKCGATDRHDFIRLYATWVKEYNNRIL